MADLSWENFVKEVFFDSETAIGLISTPPGPYPQEAVVPPKEMTHTGANPKGFDRGWFLGLNAARGFGVDVSAKRNEIPKDYLSRMTMSYLEDGPQPSHRWYGWVAGGHA